MSVNWIGTKDLQIVPVAKGAVLGLLRVKLKGRWVYPFHKGGSASDISKPENFPALFVGNCNRAGNSKIYLADGSEFDLAHPHHKDALHGTLPWRDVVWHRAYKDAPRDAVVFRMEQAKDARHFPSPSNFRAQICYAVEGAALTIAAAVTNRGRRPILASTYPHMLLYQSILGDDDPTLCFEADEHYPMNADGLPTGEVVATAGTDLDFSTERSWGYEWDHCFRGWRGTAEILYKKAGLGILIQDLIGNCSHAQVWRSRQFKVSAFEPQPTVADCSKLAKDGVPGVPVPWVQPGDTLETKVRMTFRTL